MKLLYGFLGLLIIFACTADEHETPSVSTYHETPSVSTPGFIRIYKKESDKKALGQEEYLLVLWPFLKESVAYVDLLCNQLTQQRVPLAKVFYLSPEMRYMASEVTGETFTYVKPKLKTALVWFSDGTGFSETGSGFLGDKPTLYESIREFVYIGQKVSDNQKVTYLYLQNLAKKACL